MAAGVQFFSAPPTFRRWKRPGRAASTELVWLGFAWLAEQTVIIDVGNILGRRWIQKTECAALPWYCGMQSRSPEYSVRVLCRRGICSVATFAGATSGEMSKRRGEKAAALTPRAPHEGTPDRLLITQRCRIRATANGQPGQPGRRRSGFVLSRADTSCRVLHIHPEPVFFRLGILLGRDQQRRLNIAPEPRLGRRGAVKKHQLDQRRIETPGRC